MSECIRDVLQHFKWSRCEFDQRGQPGLDEFNDRTARPGLGRGQPGHTQEAPRNTDVGRSTPVLRGCVVPEDRLRHRCPPEVSLDFPCTMHGPPARENSLKTLEIFVSR